MRAATKTGVYPDAQLYADAAAAHDYLLFNFGEAAGTALSDKSGSINAQALIGTTSGIWANPTRGITPATDTALQINTANSPAAAVAKAGRIYKFDGNRLGGIIYLAARLSIAAAPGSDTANYLFSCGRQGASGSADAYGQLSMRISAGRVPQLEIRRRGQSGSLLTPGAGAGSALVAGGSARTILCLLSEANDTDLQVDWFIDGGLSAAASSTQVGALAEGPLQNDSAGVVLLGKSAATGSFVPANFIGAGSVAPVVEWVMMGRCANTAANRTRIISSVGALHTYRRLPADFAAITR